MSDKTEKLWQELQAAQRTVAELQARLENRETGQQLATQELEESRSALLFMLEDLENARRQIEQAHREWMAALDVVKDPIFLHDKECRVLRCNKAYQQCSGMTFKQIIGQPYFKVFPKAEGPSSGCTHTMESVAIEEEILVGDATYRSRAFSIQDEKGEYLYSLHILEDITETLRASASLHESEEKFRKISESAQDAIIMMVDRRISFWNLSAERIFGYSAPEALGQDLHQLLTLPKEQAAFAQNYAHFQKTGEGPVIGKLLELTALRKGGEEFPVELSISATHLNGKWHAICVARDIGERKQHEIAMQRSNRALLTISAGNQALIHAVEEGQLLHEMCDVAVQVGGYRLAWIGFARDDAGKTIEQMALSGFEKGWPNPSPLTWDEARHESCPAGRAIISGMTCVAQNILADPELEAWHENARQYGYASCIALPLMNAKRAFGVLVIFDDKMNVFDMDEVKLLEEMSGDLAFGILTLRVKEAHREHEQRLQKNMLQTVEAIASIVEMRDPYTSGHQARVAALAKEIARQMGLAEEEVQAIHLAGLVHDLGKIRIPAEILSKPGRLNEIEYSLIKMHPQAGYDILKGVDFSWPIAEMVLQHHERVDGSGYPQGLKGEGILLGARILIVADVVEAMSSHRPYRPGLGVDAALEEITRSRGTRYDEKVVDACVALFRERGYVLPG
jgi:PAS domain S-box-containing protein